MGEIVYRIDEHDNIHIVPCLPKGTVGHYAPILYSAKYYFDDALHDIYRISKPVEIPGYSWMTYREFMDSCEINIRLKSVLVIIISEERYLA